jgi:hypothetical protein
MRNILFLMPLALTMVLSCNKRSDSLPVKHDMVQTSTEKMNKVKARFNSLIAKIEKIAPEQIREERELLWSKAIAYKLDGYTVYQVPIRSKKGRVYAVRDKFAQAKKPENGLLALGYKYAVIRVYDDVKLDFAIMTIQATESYLKENGNSLEGNSYKKMKPDFSGLVLFHNWNNELIVGWEYTSGKVSKRLGEKFSNPLGRIVECTTVTVDWYCQECNDWYTNGTYSHTQCSQWYYCGPAAEMFFCTIEVEAGDPPGSGSPGGFVYGWTGGAGTAHLCQANVIAMNMVGNAYVGQLSALMPRFVHLSTSPSQLRDYELNFPIVCISIPKYGLLNAGMASEVFRIAHNNAVTSTIGILNASGPNLTSIQVQEIFKTEVTEWLSMYHPQASIAFGPCFGTIPVTQAKYGGACN